VASIIFFMVFSLLTANDSVSLKTTPLRIYSRNGVECPKFRGSLRRKPGSY
jgi:hypothetical protein